MTLKQTGLVILLSLFALTAMAADYIGGKACARCHQEEYQRWQGSHHDRAMQVATPATVLGDFEDARFTLHGSSTRFFRKDGGFWVNTDGPDGRPHDYRIEYTFGVAPLQQYLIKFPGGRLQALDIAWDSRPKAEGGQRWFHLHPETPVASTDVLHWTGPYLNWNYMCADCHSTNLKKNYDGSADSYKTTYTDIDVSCEACHGPGSAHVAWANAMKTGGESKLANKGLSIELDERRGVHWSQNPVTGKPQRSQPNTHRKEIDVCAHCHARRGQLRDGFMPGQAFLDAYRPALLTEGLYHADGQIQDEVYVWGSFLQSRMYHAGVTCSDCHDPHAADLKAPGDQVCNQCHAPRRYATPTHHHHTPDSAGARCVECHMPARTYMGVDKRRDHGFRVPRPDLSLSTGSPNACNQCHKDRTADWALKKMESWYGRPSRGFQKFAPALAAAKKAQPDAASLLLKLALDGEQSAIARATALGYLGSAIDQTVFLTIQKNLQAEDPLLRMGALNALESAPRRLRMLAIPLVWDKLKAIRIQAARLLAGYTIKELKPEQQKVLDDALQEYIEVQQFNGDRPENQVNLGALYVDLRQFDRAEAAFRKALQLQAKYVPARIQLARLLERRGKAREAEKLLYAGLNKIPDSADLQHALGLLLVRAGRLDDALDPLHKATQLAPENSRYAYVYAVALHDTGKGKEALKVLAQAQRTHPTDIDLLSALVSYNRDAGDPEAALKWLRQLQTLVPDDPEVNRLLQSLEESH